MIVITTPRKIGELGRHLARTGRGSNKQVIIRDDLTRESPLDPTLALRMMAALSRQNRRVQRDIVHIKIAPKLALTAEGLERVLALIEAEYGIPSDCPRHIVEHRKGDRAPHFHVNYPMVAPGHHKALRFEHSRERDEMIARRLEIELGEGPVPSVRVERVAEMLRQRGHHDLAEIASTGPVAEKGMRRSKAELQQAARLEADPELIDARLLAAWRKSGGDIHRLADELEVAGFHLAAGNKLVAGRPLVRVIDVETLNASSLTRDLNRLTKARGEGARLRETEIGQVFGALRPESEVRAELRREQPQRAAADLLGEFDRFVQETGRDGEADAAVRAKKAREVLAKRLSVEERAELRQRQAMVRARYRERDRVRRARVNRAFIAARLFAGVELRKLAFYLVAAGALATGAGLVAALAVAGVTVASLPSFVGAKRLRVEAAEAVVADRAAMANEIQRESRSFFRDRAIALRVAEQKARAAEKARFQKASQARAAQSERQRRAGFAALQEQAARQALAKEQRLRQAQRIRANRGPGGPGETGQQPNVGRPRQLQRSRSFER